MDPPFVRVLGAILVLPISYQLPVTTPLVLNSVWRLLVFIANSHDVEPPSITARRPCPIDVCINVNLLLFKLNSAIVNCKLMLAEELSPGHLLDCKAQSCIRRKAGNNEEHLVVVQLQMELTGKVAAMVIARIEHKPEGLGFGDEF
jgi:hypothetical protein